MPICCASASAAVRVPSAISRSAKPSGMMFFTFCPTSSSRRYPNCFSACTFSRTISPLWFTTTIASGAASSSPRYRPSICARCFSASLRTLMSRIAAVTRIPSALSSGLSMISMGNSLPSLRRPDELDPGTDLLRQRFGRGARAVRDQPFREALRNDVLHLLPDQFIAAVSELLLRLHVQQNDFSALVHHHHRIRSRFQQPAVPAFDLRQMLLRVRCR